MKGIIIIGALALVHGNAVDYNINGCPRNHKVERLLPHEEDCRQFYQCFNGIRIMQICPVGLYFDSEREICDWPQNANCGNKQEDDDASTDITEELDFSDPSQAPKICSTPDSNGILVAHENCNKFYICTSGIPVTFYCPSNLLYNPGKERCDWPEKVDCENRPISESDNNNNDTSENITESEDCEDDTNGNGVIVYDDPSKAPAICKSENSENVLVAHENCNYYYKCSQGLPVALKCPINLLYNPTKLYCDWPENVKCGDRVIYEIDENTNSKNKKMVARYVRDVENGINSEPSEAISICASKDSDEFLIVHEYCNKFYKCSHGLPVAFKCAVNLLYNPEKKYCDWPENVNCNSRVLPETNSENDEINSVPNPEIEGSGGSNHGENSDPGEAPSICAAKDSDGILVAHENCNQFYKCFDGFPVAMSCPLNLLYDPTKKYCDWPEAVDCGNRGISDLDVDNTTVNGNGEENGGNDGYEIPEKDINDDPSKAPEICTSKGSDGILVAHEKCNQFYKCFQGHPVAMSCPVNLLYQPSKEYCDWPEAVDCGNRVIPDPDNNNTNVDGNEQENEDSGGYEVPEQDINDEPSKAPEICATKPSDGILVAHENCNQFYKCFEGLPVTLSCPLNLLYDPSKEYCDWPETVDCGNRGISDPDVDNTTDGNGEESGGNEIPEQNINDDPSKAPEICVIKGSDGILVAHENCNQFYKCFQGHPVAMSCPLNLLYQPSKEYCDWPEAVNCGNRVIPDPDDNSTHVDGNGQENEDNDGYEIPEQDINDDPSKASEICAAEGSDGVLVAHEICNKFYKCSERIPVVLLCPANLLYNPIFKYCDWPQNVDCGDRILMQEDDNKDKTEDSDDESKLDQTNYEAQAADICAESSSNGVLVPHDNCDQFYKCAFGLPIAMACPTGLQYNPSSQVCDWPSNVKCDNRAKKIHSQKSNLEAKKALKLLLRVY